MNDPYNKPSNNNTEYYNKSDYSSYEDELRAQIRKDFYSEKGREEQKHLNPRLLLAIERFLSGENIEDLDWLSVWREPVDAFWDVELQSIFSDQYLNELVIYDKAAKAREENDLISVEEFQLAADEIRKEINRHDDFITSKYEELFPFDKTPIITYTEHPEDDLNNYRQEMFRKSKEVRRKYKEAFESDKMPWIEIQDPEYQQEFLDFIYNNGPVPLRIEELILPLM